MEAHAAAALRNAAPAVQQDVLAGGSMVDARDPTGVLLSRIGKAKKAQAAGPPPPAPVGKAAAPGIPPPAAVGKAAAPGVFPISAAHATVTEFKVGEATSHLALVLKSCVGSSLEHIQTRDPFWYFWFANGV